MGGTGLLDGDSEESREAKLVSAACRAALCGVVVVAPLRDLQSQNFPSVGHILVRPQDTFHTAVRRGNFFVLRTSESHGGTVSACLRKLA